MSSFTSSQTGMHDREEPVKITRPGTLVPLTIRQVLSSKVEDKNVFVNGKLSETVKLLGRVIQKSDEVTNPFMVISDCTGVLRVKTVLRNDHEKQSFQDIQVGQYYRFFGFISAINDKQLIAQSFGPIRCDFNEITLHYIAAVYTHLVHKGSIEPPKQQPPKEVQQNAQQTAPQLLNTSNVQSIPHGNN